MIATKLFLIDVILLDGNGGNSKGVIIALDNSKGDIIAFSDSKGNITALDNIKGDNFALGKCSIYNKLP